MTGNMKKAAVLFVVIMIFSCTGGGAKKPERLLSEDEMVSILYDLSLLQAIQSTEPMKLQDKNVEATTYIYKKYKIDSLTFAQNHTYYASDIEGYQAIHKKVTDKLKAEKAPYDTIAARAARKAGDKDKKQKRLRPAAIPGTAQPAP